MKKEELDRKEFRCFECKSIISPGEEKCSQCGWSWSGRLEPESDGYEEGDLGEDIKLSKRQLRMLNKCNVVSVKKIERWRMFFLLSILIFCIAKIIFFYNSNYNWYIFPLFCAGMGIFEEIYEREKIILYLKQQLSRNKK